jgi:uncharacterized membrane protein
MATTYPESNPSTPAAARSAPHIRHITLADLRIALARGWQDFSDTPTQLIFLGVIYTLVGLIAGRWASGGRLLPLFWPLVAGLTLLGPVTALGLYEISRQRERGRDTSWLTAFDALRSPGLFSLGVMAVYLLALFVAWIIAAQWLWNGIMGSLPQPNSIGELVNLVFNTSEGWRLLFWGNLVGLFFALAAFVMTVVSFPMELDAPSDPGTAMATSFRAVMKNPVPMLAWGLIVAVLVFLACLPAFIGLAVVMPWLGHSTWHLYRRVVQP